MPADSENGWRQVKLKDVCREITVGHVGPMASEYVEEGIPFFRSQNIQPFRVDLTDIKYIRPEFHQKLRKSAVSPGDVLVVRTGYPGTACVLPKDVPIANCSDLVIIRPSPDLDPWFLASLFNSAWGRGTVSGSLVGVAQQHFNIGVAREMVITLPPISTQRKVTSMLSAYDDLIENNTRRIKILEEMARAIYREWFVHFHFPGHEKIKLVDSPLGKIPEGWEVKRLGDIAAVNESSIKRGQEPAQIKYIDISSVSNGQILRVEPVAFVDAPGRARRKVKHGDIIWSAVRPNLRAFCIVLDPHPELIVSTGFVVISPERVPYTYLYQVLTTDEFVDYLVNHTRGAAYPAVNTEDFENAQIVVPDAEVLSSYHDLVSDLYALRQSLFEKSARLSSTRDLLLPRLISGEIRMNNDAAFNGRKV